MRRPVIALVNPNTSGATTGAMVAIASEAAAGRAMIEGLTAPFGAALITGPAALDTAREAVVALVPALGGADAVIVAAFGDPGVDELRAALDVPVTGIAEASMAEAARRPPRFAVVTTTPDLRERIAAAAARHGHGGFLGTHVTPGDPAELTANAEALVAALADACEAAVRDGAEAIVIGGGPLAVAARALARTVRVPLVEPVPAAVRLALDRLTLDRLASEPARKPAP